MEVYLTLDLPLYRWAFYAFLLVLVSDRYSGFFYRTNNHYIYFGKAIETNSGVY